MQITDIRPRDEESRVHSPTQARWLGPERPEGAQHRRKDGRIIDVEITAHTLEFAGQQAVLVVAFDVTERKHLEEQLRQSQKMEVIGQLAGGVAHDFNNLLTVIIGYGELVYDGLSANAPEQQWVQQILRAIESAALLTRQLLAFSRRQIISPREIDLNDVVEQLGAMLGRVLGEDIAFSVTILLI